MEVEEELYYPNGEHKVADQLCSYCTADLRLCFRICKLLGFSCTGSNIENQFDTKMRIFMLVMLRFAFVKVAMLHRLQAEVFHSIHVAHLFNITCTFTF